MLSLATLLKGSFLLALAAPAYANYGQLGFSLGVKRNSDGQCKEAVDFEADFDILAPYTKVVRTYATSDCNTMQNIMPALAKKGFKIVLGVWYVCLFIIVTLTLTFICIQATSGPWGVGCCFGANG